MVEFNIRETGNEIMKTLQKELHSKDSCRLSVDVLIPENLCGDKPGLCNSILAICKYLDRNITHLIVDIELLRVGRNSESIQLNIEVKGSNADLGLSGSIKVLAQDGIDRLLNSLPYLTTCIKSDILAQFNFRMIFEYSRDRSRATNSSDGKMILLAEDSDVSALVLMAFLEEWGYRVTRVTNGQQAVEEVRRTRFDMVFIDTYMPGMSGIDAIKKIRQLEPDVPIIAACVESMKQASLQAKEAGASNIITKPIDSNELQKILTHHFGNFSE